VIVVVLAVAGVLSAAWSSTRLRRLAAVRLRHVELVWVALVTQIVLFEVLVSTLPTPLIEIGHYATYAACVGFIVLNRQLPGAWLIALGTSSNLVAIAANGGSMPADAAAWRRAGKPPVSPEVFENSRVVSDARLGFLGDTFAIPAGWPFANVFSLGDVAIVLGATYLAHRLCAARGNVPTERFELSLTRT
jgi:hypothetical protein